MEELDFYACPECSGKLGKGGKRKFEPAQSEIEMLIRLMDNSNDNE